MNLAIFEIFILATKFSSRMFANILLFFYIAAFIYGSAVCAQAPTAYIHTFGGVNMDEGRDIQYTSDKGFIIAGTTSSFGAGNTDIYLIKTDSVCNHQWSKAIGGTGIEWGYSVRQTFDKGYVVAGYTNSQGNGGYDAYLVKTDSAGQTLWEKAYGGSDWDFGYCVQQLPDSGFVLCGETYSFGNKGANAFFIRTDKNGDTLWTSCTGGDSTDIAHSIVVYNDSTYFFAGETNSSGNGGSDVFYGAIHKNGIIIKTGKFGSAQNDRGHWIEKSMDGNMFIFGETDSTTAALIKTNELLLKIDSNCAIVWSQPELYGSAGIDIGRTVKEKSNGDLLTCATSGTGGNGGTSLHMMMLNSGGWWLSGPAFGGMKDEEGYSLVITPKKEVVFVGSTRSYGQGMQDVYLIRLKSDSMEMIYNLNIYTYNDTTLSLLAIPEYEDKLQVMVYPNPFTECATLTVENWHELKTKTAEMKIYNLLGGEIYKSEIRDSKSEFKKGNLDNGIYFFTITSASETMFRGKMIIQ